MRPSPAGPRSKLRLGPSARRCIVCGGLGVADAFYCKACTMLEKDRDGCPKIVNLSSNKLDNHYEKKKYATGGLQPG